MRGLLPGLVLVYSCICLHVSGYVMQEIFLCSFGDDTGGNVTFQYFITFNHVPALGYNNSAGKFFTEYAINETIRVVENYTKEFNNNTEMLYYVQSEEERCKDSVKTFWNGTVQRRVKPSMEVFSPEEFNGENLPVLICHVWGFYPQDIVVTLVKNDKMVVKKETNSVRAGDWTYQVVVKLDLRDSLPGDNYTCIVEHPSLDGSMMKTWKSGLTSAQITKISVAAGFFALGLITLIAGVFCWRNAKRRDDGHFLPTISCPWCLIFAPRLPHSLVSLCSNSTSSLASCDSRLLMDEERDLGEDSDTDSLEGELILGENSGVQVMTESSAPSHQGCALESVVKNLDDDDRPCFPI